MAKIVEANRWERRAFDRHLNGAFGETVPSGDSLDGPAFLEEAPADAVVLLDERDESRRDPLWAQRPPVLAPLSMFHPK
ncbi:hypothetical protein AB0C21_08115 [Spirillospora sp. NPDC049024]